MNTPQIQLSHVINNAANQHFEALATLHDRGASRSYPCAIAAPITMTFADAARGLTTQALRRHKAHQHPGSSVVAHHPPQRAGRPDVARPRFDLVNWLRGIATMPRRRAA